jgi:CHAT domain-containing protein/tetratricopeptide (TPR) repeat protein
MKKIFLFSIALIIFNCQYSIVHCQSWKEMMDSSKFYQEKQDYGTALKWAQLALKQTEKEFGKNDSNYTSTLSTIGEVYNKLGEADSSLFYFKISLIKNKENFKGDHPEMVRCLHNLAAFYQSHNDFTTAEPLLKEVLAMCKRLYKGDHHNVAMSLDNLASFYVSQRKLPEAEPLFKESLEMLKRIHKGDHPDVASGLSNLALVYQYWGRFSDAEPILKESLEMYRRIFIGDHPELGMILNNLAMLYLELGRLIEAEPLFKEVTEMTKRLFKGDHPDLASNLNNLALFYEAQGRLSEAEPLKREALEMRRRLFKGDNDLLALSLNNLGSLYEEQGKLKEAEPLYIEALDMYKRIFQGDHPYISMCLNNLGSLYDSQGRFTEAETQKKEALEMSRRLYKGDHPSLAININNLAGLYQYQGRFSEAEPLYIEALEMRKRIFKGDHPSLAKSLNNLAFLFLSQYRFIEAEPYLKMALEMYKRLYKMDHLNIGMTMNNLAFVYQSLGRFIEADSLYLKALELYKNNYIHNAINLSEKEKKQYWNTTRRVFEGFNSFATNRLVENPNIIGKMYDNQLFSKGLLINSTRKVKERILKSKDSSLISKYMDWKEKKTFLLKLYKMTKNELQKKRFNVDSTENIANQLEKELTLKSEDFKHANEQKIVSWKNIQETLKPDEAAVEVIRFSRYKNKYPSDTIIYAFLILTIETKENPDIVILENGKELENEYFNHYRYCIFNKKPDLMSFNRYWAKLYEKIKENKTIYFSADGVYNKLNPSTFMLTNKEYLNEVQDIHFVTSTKDLLKKTEQHKDDNIRKSALLIGNPNYFLSKEKVNEISYKLTNKHPEEETKEMVSGIRGMIIEALPGTEKEVNNIGVFLKRNGWEVKSYSGDAAVKSVIKTINNPRVLHIATHSFFLEDIGHGEKETFGFEEQKFIENPLLRSGLIFAGAANTLSIIDSANNIRDDNSILTAYEAMNLELDSTELVVLSACETGLGVIQNGEGVYGLRRAFQQAGARTLMLSLWKVNDEATEKLMTIFYEKWLEGNSKCEAFTAAQKEIRNIYQAPYYWGAFVMVGE